MVPVRRLRVQLTQTTKDHALNNLDPAALTLGLTTGTGIGLAAGTLALWLHLNRPEPATTRRPLYHRGRHRRTHRRKDAP